MRSGVYTDTGAKRMVSKKHRPKKILNTVLDAVRWGLNRSDGSFGNASSASDPLDEKQSGPDSFR